MMNTDDLHLVPHNSNNSEYERLLIKRMDLWLGWENQQIWVHLLALSCTFASSRGKGSTLLKSSHYNLGIQSKLLIWFLLDS